MNVLSLFDGMSCGRIALERAGIDVDNYFSSEIKPYAIKAANTNYPQDAFNRLGDICTIKGVDLPQIDLLIGGSPCQDFSQANKNRLGVSGIKSKLFFEYLRLLNECSPKYFLLENVRMKQDQQDLVSATLGCEPITINSELVSPQLRHRLYWTNIPYTAPPENTFTTLNSVLVDGWSDRLKARALLESDSRPLSSPIKMAHRYFNKGFTTLIFKTEDHYNSVKSHFYSNFKGKTATEIDHMIDSNHKPLIDGMSVYEGLRYMTPSEREACQTVPIGYTKTLSTSEAACVLGDGWTVDVIAHIFKGLKCN